jgi:hypothetical protein
MANPIIKVLSHNYTGKSLAVVFLFNGKLQNKIADASHLNWKSLEKAYKAGDFNKVVELIDITTAINRGFEGKFVVKNGKVYAGDEVVTGYLFDRILFFLENGLPYQRLLTFAKNLWANPSEKARKDLYKFLEHGNFPLTDNGTFIAYKGVQNDYYSITGGSLTLIKGKTNDAGKIFNGIGQTIEVDRSAVNPNEHQTCSYGLHAGSFKYADDFKSGGRLVLVEIDPRDVVSIPSDCNQQKLRTCKYKVIGEVGGEGLPTAPLNDADPDIIEKVDVTYHNVRDSKGRFKKVRKSR